MVNCIWVIADDVLHPDGTLTVVLKGGSLLCLLPQPMLAARACG